MPAVGAVTMHYTKSDGPVMERDAVIVAVSEDSQRRGLDDPTGLLTLLVHEASHVVDIYFRDILNEREPASEQRAYALQMCSRTLIEAVSRQTHAARRAHDAAQAARRAARRARQTTPETPRA